MASRKQKFDDEHLVYIRERTVGKSDLEIKRNLGWSNATLRRHQALAFEDGVKFNNNSCELIIEHTDMPEKVIRFFNVSLKDPLIKFKKDTNTGKTIVEVF